MSITEALYIYNHPDGHSIDELLECLEVLNESPYTYPTLQKDALIDAQVRLIFLSKISEFY